MTKRDHRLRKVLEMTKHGIFPMKWKDVLRLTELSTQGYVPSWGNRVMIPPAGRQTLLTELHLIQPGIVKMKSLTRSGIWWTLWIQKYSLVFNHVIHTSIAAINLGRHNYILGWIFTDRHWSRLHIDYCDPKSSQILLVIIGSHSKLLEVHITSTTTSEITIEHLQRTYTWYTSILILL